MRPEPLATEIAYLAGIIDGEGNISVSRCLRKTRDSYLYSVRLVVTNTRPDLIEWIRGRFGGRVQVKSPPTARHRAAYRWTVDGRRARPILTQVYPYLVLKSHQARIALAYLNLRGLHVPTVRAELWEQMRALNLRGPDNTTVSGSTSVTRKSGQMEIEP